LEYFIKAKNVKAFNKNDYLRTVGFLNIGECYLYLNQLDSALLYLEANYLLAKHNRYKDIYGDFERLLGEVKAAKDSPDEALTWFNKSIWSYEAVDDKQHSSMT